MKQTAWKPALALIATLAALSPIGATAEPSTGASVGAPAASSTEAWAPVRALIGNWSGVKSAPDVALTGGATKVSRKFETGLNSKHVEVSEKAGSAPWGVAGVISFDAERGALVLRQFASDGKAADLPFDAAGSSDTKLVFAGLADNPGRTRVTYERAGWNQFTERVEYAPHGEGYSLLSETRFKRKG